jgi:hypothetical protein
MIAFTSLSLLSFASPISGVQGRAFFTRGERVPAIEAWRVVGSCRRAICLERGRGDRKSTGAAARSEAMASATSARSRRCGARACADLPRPCQRPLRPSVWPPEARKVSRA